MADSRKGCATLPPSQSVVQAATLTFAPGEIYDFEFTGDRRRVDAAIRDAEPERTTEQAEDRCSDSAVGNKIGATSCATVIIPPCPIRRIVELARRRGSLAAVLTTLQRPTILAAAFAGRIQSAERAAPTCPLRRSTHTDLFLPAVRTPGALKEVVCHPFPRVPRGCCRLSPT